MGVGEHQSNPCKKCSASHGLIRRCYDTRGLGELDISKAPGGALGEAGQMAGPGSQRLPVKPPFSGELRENAALHGVIC